MISKAADRALIVATHQPASIRAAERTSIMLDELGIEDRRLIINRFDASAVKKGIRPGIIDIIDRTYIQLV
jgi:septum formation inhibitor-activating ATPase MinD